jgi:hypothetical protein
MHQQQQNLMQLLASKMKMGWQQQQQQQKMYRQVSQITLTSNRVVLLTVKQMLLKVRLRLLPV